MERFIVKKHNQHYWSIYHTLEETKTEEKKEDSTLN